MRIPELRVGLLMYFVGTEYVYAVLLDQAGRAEKFRLMPCEQAFPLIDELFEAMEGTYGAAASAAAFQRFSCDWGTRLLPPASALSSFDILIIITHHTLHGFPFHAIQLSDDGQYLAQTHGVTYSSSGTLLTRCVERNLARQTKLSDWEFGLDAEPIGPRSARRWKCFSAGVDVKYENTKNYQALAAIFAAYFGGGEFSDPSRFHIKYHSTVWDKRDRSELERWQVACIVCHGYYDSARTDDSGLLVEAMLGGSGVSERPIVLADGKPYLFRDLPFRYLPVEIEPRPNCQAELLTLSELKIDCSSNAQLVALLGCSTAAGQILSGDDFASLAYQWLKIGAVTVLANLWELDFNLINRWLPLFLTNWVERGQPKAIAWREALKQLLNEEPKLSSYDWGCIVLLGDWL